MRLFTSALAAASVLLCGSPAMAWGAKGHQQVGAIAERLLNPRARAELKSLLTGFGATNTTGRPDLASAAVWADCVRDVSRSGGTFTYARGQYTPAACFQFEDTVEEDRMKDYASRNWTQCVYYPGCHGAYHFADVAIQHDHYDPALGYVGTSDHDVVSAIKACIAVLQGGSAPPPFNIRDKKEAALLLAHFVGDLHQPLHVGAVYLEDDGDRVDPDASPADDKDSETRGGNSLKFGSDKNLHSTWDGVPSGWPVPPTTATLAKARNVPGTQGALADKPATWATESIREARKAYDGLTFSAVGVASNNSRYWIAQFTNEAAYGQARRSMQSRQVVKAGARLAEIYNAIWPET
ncbi:MULTISPECIES: S1/P1 nuclease [unclassified Phenylobacterium]|uniref:S1/P1 nuclease n=1 Tax=unclassified Phenylobacterium TaxID=2640670 RepID=UPI00083AB744|nr:MULTISPECIES: S1/P1 nuclease [unclassified Phenylobacterium]